MVGGGCFRFRNNQRGRNCAFKAPSRKRKVDRTTRTKEKKDGTSRLQQSSGSAPGGVDGAGK